MNTLHPSTQPQSKEPAKFSLKAPGTTYTTPYIEHWVLQLHGIAPERIDDPDLLGDTLNHAVANLGLTRVSSHSHYFGPGVSTVVILSESHLSAHTWPETGYMHLDIVTCVRKLTHEKLRTVLDAAFQAESLQVTRLEY